ncbi:hypothetical protein ACFQY7_26670 [Actinomadura luteofluorescens]|uniref:DODA-type extradiol aromatic ring-opening family dioxygenase n=1 Tax=Actinomadura luteofluorescens TaxID=46163 RepID=UPI003643AE5D
MGEVVGAGLLAHVPTIVLPEVTRRELNGGEDTTLVSGLRRLRADVFERDDYDTVVVLDSHWATTVEFVTTAQDRRAGLYTSEELPRGMCRMPYDFPGDPELARAVARYADRHGTYITPIDDPYLPIYYATVNLWTHLGVRDDPYLGEPGGGGCRSACARPPTPRTSCASAAPSATPSPRPTAASC